MQAVARVSEVAVLEWVEAALVRAAQELVPALAADLRARVSAAAQAPGPVVLPAEVSSPWAARLRCLSHSNKHSAAPRRRALRARDDYALP